RDKNKVEVELPETVAGKLDNRPAFEVDCAKPEKGQRLHLLLVSADPRDGDKTLVDRMAKALRLPTAEKGQVGPPAFAAVTVHDVLTGFNVARRKIRASLQLIRLAVQQHHDNDRRSSADAMEDVVVVYYKGGEVRQEQGTFVGVRPGASAAQAASGGIDLRELEQLMGSCPGARLALLDTVQTAQPPGERVGQRAPWPVDSRVALIRVSWRVTSASLLPEEERLTPAWVQALSSAATLKDVVQFLDRRFEQVS